MICKEYRAWLERYRDSLRTKISTEYNSFNPDEDYIVKLENRINEINNALCGYVQPLNELYKLYKSWYNLSSKCKNSMFW